MRSLRQRLATVTSPIKGLVKRCFGLLDPLLRPRNASLHSAATLGDIEYCQQLLSNGESLSTVDGRGWTPLMYAAYAGHVEICHLLVSAGADPYFCLPNDESALTNAGTFIDEKAIPVLRVLCLASSSRDGEHSAQAARSKNAALLSFVMTGSTSTAKFLVDCGVDVNWVTKGSWTPLLMAARNNVVGCCEMLIENGADPRIAARVHGKMILTPFQVAVKYGCADVVAYFLKQVGEDPYQRTQCGSTMDELAADNERVMEQINSFRSVEAISSALSGACDATSADKSEEDCAGAVIRRSRSSEIL